MFKIESIRFIDGTELPAIRRNTVRAGMVATIIDNLSKAPPGKHLFIATSDLEPYERFGLQKALQARGQHVQVHIGENPATKKPSLFIRKLTDAEWKEHIDALRARDERRAVKIRPKAAAAKK
jgi:hypothetical protein